LTKIYTLSLHDALPICKFFGLQNIETSQIHLGDTVVQEIDGIEIVTARINRGVSRLGAKFQHALRSPIGRVDRHQIAAGVIAQRSEEHTSELQSPCNLV